MWRKWLTTARLHALAAFFTGIAACGTTDRESQPPCTSSVDCPSDLTCQDRFCVPFGLNSGPNLAARDSGQPTFSLDAGTTGTDAGQLDATAPRDTGTGPGSVGTACFNNTQCVTSLFCDGMSCGDTLGECAQRPSACTAIYDPVCACDGRTYSNRCAAAMAGARVALPGPCP